jgi:hypothetical protein
LLLLLLLLVSLSVLLLLFPLLPLSHHIPLHSCAVRAALVLVLLLLLACDLGYCCACVVCAFVFVLFVGISVQQYVNMSKPGKLPLNLITQVERPDIDYEGGISARRPKGQGTDHQCTLGRPHNLLA